MTTFGLGQSLFTVDRGNSITGDPVTAIESLAALGFRKTELLADGERWKRPALHEAARLKNALEHFDVDPASIHTPIKGIDLTSADSAIRRESVGRIAEAMRFGAEMGTRTAIVHPSGKPDAQGRPYSWENLGEAMEHAHESVSELVKVSQETGVRIALENLSGVKMKCRPLETMQELRAFIASLPSKYVGLCLDVGHSRISGFDPAEQARVASERLWALHLHDVDGSEDSHWVPGRGVIDWDSLAQALSDIGFQGDWTLEVLVTHSEASAAKIGEECTALRQLWESNGMCDPRAR